MPAIADASLARLTMLGEKGLRIKHNFGVDYIFRKKSNKYDTRSSYLTPIDCFASP